MNKSNKSPTMSNKIPPRPGKNYEWEWDEWDEKWVKTGPDGQPTTTSPTSSEEIGFRTADIQNDPVIERTITVVAIDCSGSMKDKYLERAVKIANSLNSPNTVYVQFSHKVHIMGELSCVSFKDFRVLSGGTDFEELQRALSSLKDIKQVIVLTDDHPAMNDWVSMKRWAFIDVGI